MASANQELQQAIEHLRKPLENLKPFASSLTSFTLQWKDLEEFYLSIQKSIEDLELKPNQIPSTENSDNLSISFKKQYDWYMEPRPEMKHFCVDMDGKGLLVYLIENPKERNGFLTRDEVASSLLFSPDPALLVLDALLGFYPNAEDGKRFNLIDTRRTCVHLLEQFMTITLMSMRLEVIEEARKMAMEWKEKIRVNGGSDYMEVLGFLLLLAAYKLGSEFNMNGELVDLVEVIAQRDKAPELCRIFGLANKMPEFVEKLIKKRKRGEAINLIYGFGLVDKFPVFPLLKEELRDAKKDAKRICKKGNNSVKWQYKAIDRQIAAVRQVISCIENHKIECKYSSINLHKRLNQLVCEKREIRRKAKTSANANQLQKQSRNKNVKPQNLGAKAAPKNKKIVSERPVCQMMQRPKWHETGASMSSNSAYVNRPSGSYGLAGFASANPYMNSSGGHFVFNGNYAGGCANMIPSQFHLGGAQTGNFLNGRAGRYSNGNS